MKQSFLQSYIAHSLRRVNQLLSLQPGFNDSWPDSLICMSLFPEEAALIGCTGASLLTCKCRLSSMRPHSSAVLAQVVHHELSVPDVTQLLLSVACWAIARATGALLADLPSAASRANLEPFWGVGAVVAIAVVRANPASASFAG